MGVRIQELPETTGINKEDVLIVEDGQGTKKGTVQQLYEALGVSQLNEDLSELDETINGKKRSEEKSFPINISGSFKPDGSFAASSFYYSTGEIAIPDGTSAIEYYGTANSQNCIIIIFDGSHNIIFSKVGTGVSNAIEGYVEVTSEMKSFAVSCYNGNTIIQTAYARMLTTVKGASVFDLIEDVATSSIAHTDFEIDKISKPITQTDFIVGKNIKSVKAYVSRNYRSFEYTDTSELPLPVMYDGCKFACSFVDNRSYGTDLFVSANGGGDGHTRNTPTTLDNAINIAKANGSANIHLSKGFYYVAGIIDFLLVNLRIACDDGIAYLINDTEKRLFTQYNSILMTNIANNQIAKVIEIIDGDYAQLSIANNIAECEITKGSYIVDGTNLYVNSFTGNSDNIIPTLANGLSPVKNLLASTETGVNNTCFENLIFLGGANCVRIKNNGNNIFNNCSFIGSYGYGNNCLSVNGNAKSICLNCYAKFSTSDGFNYHGNTRFIEVDCISGCHGFDLDSRTNSNATTSHETAKGLRINGVYFYTNGPIVADVGTATTINSNCVAFESKSTSGNGGFITDTGVMYCYSCLTDDTGHGGYSQTSTGKVYSKNCKFDGTSNDVAIE